MAVFVSCRRRVAKHDIPLRAPRGNAGNIGCARCRQHRVRVADSEQEYHRYAYANALAVAKLQPISIAQFKSHIDIVTPHVPVKYYV